MKWTKFVVIAGCLCLGNVVLSVSQAQPKHQVTPTEGTASMEGTVQDGTTKQPIAGAVVMAKNQDGLVRAQQKTNADGAFLLKLDPKLSYIITTKAEGYSTLDEQLAFTSGSTNRLYGKVIRLFKGIAQPTATTTAARTTTVSVASASASSVPLEQVTVVGKKRIPDQQNDERVTPPKTLDAKVVYTPPLIVAPTGKTTQLRALQFVQSKAELLPDAQPALEQLLQFMQSKPTAEIELSGHTDNQGDFDQNLLLSKQRVDVVKDYLVKNGIAANRITTRGYGPTRPIASNNAENTRQLNRRVELIVVKQ